MQNKYVDKLSRLSAVETFAVSTSLRLNAILDVILRRERQKARAEAKRLWSIGSLQQSIELLRGAETRFGKDSETSVLLAKIRLELGTTESALSSVLDALQKDPSNLEAYDLLLDLDAKVKLDKLTRTEASARFAASISVSSPDQIEALYLLHPQLALNEYVSEKVRLLSTSSTNGVAKSVAALMVGEGGETPFATGMSQDEKVLSRGIYAVMLGRHTEALKCIHAVNADLWPRQLFEFVANRERRRGRIASADRYMSLATSPTQVGATSKLQKVSGLLAATKINNDIFNNGYPFSSPAVKRSVEPELNRSFYFLHNSLPYNSAGYATRTHGLLSGLNRNGWAPEGVTRLGYPSDNYDFDIQQIPTEHEVDGITYHHLVDVKDRRMLKTPVTTYVNKYVSAASNLVVSRKPLILHGASNHWNGLAAAELGRKYGLPSVYEVRGLWEVTRASREPDYFGSTHYLQRAAIEAEAANGCDRVITITNALREEMILRGVSSDKITVVPNGVDTSRFQPLPKNEELAKNLDVEDKLVIGYVGSVLDYEGLDLLFDVAKRLLKARNDVAFLVVGDGAKFEELKAKVVHAGLEREFILTGRVPHEEVENYYSLIDICPFPRKPLPVCEMVSPLKPFEALAMQKAVVVSSVAAMAEIIEDGVTGLQYEKGSADSLEEKLDLLLSDRELRARIASNGLDWVRENRDWRDLGQIVGEIYADLGGIPQ